jgi:ribosomal protein L14
VPRLVLALFALAVSAPSAAGADDLLTQFHLAPSGIAQTKATVTKGTTYVMSIAGSRKKDDSGGHFENNDAFYCFESDAAGVCPPKASEAHAEAAIAVSSDNQNTILPLQKYVVDEQPYPFDATWRTPFYAATHKYMVRFRPQATGKLIMYSSAHCGPPSTCSGPGFDIQVFKPSDDPCASTSRAAHAAAVNEIRVVAVAQDVAAHKAGTPDDNWVQVCKDTVLQQGDEISTDPDGAATIQFADNSTVVVKNTTQLKIASFFTEGGIVKTEILLKMGEIAAKVCKSCATHSDFRIKSPTGTASVRGTDFSVFYDPGSKAMLTTVREGIVDVTPVKTSLKAVQLTAGQEVEVTGKAISNVAKAGKAGARGGLNRLAALAKVLKVIARANGPCGVHTPRVNAFAVATAKSGWGVTVKLLGKRKGSSKWAVKGSRVQAKNALARKLAGKCR